MRNHDFSAGSLFAALPAALDDEVFEDLIRAPGCRIERIVSNGQATPEGEWYCQQQHEWVMLLEGAAELGFEDGRSLVMKPGDHVNLPKGLKHRVNSTKADGISIWLAVFYD
ncbi:cupin domain-containing protein [Shewanella cyperi]|uniref:Cupin domain-containing protein n=1 Tax=Shewanella cyperi TaxID=2814292 RepID=A0A975AK64_9GAMM|nr:cupin domain-containing protein [Shewanella cyperi]QSX29416.1 cupin domain-containing protein [Shewanella cyperi]QSX40192.1 cupin domain-containing protein [Shewanella cyperi]